MSGILSEGKRQVVPRWLPFDSARKLRHNLSHSQAKELLQLRQACEGQLDRAVGDWLVDRDSVSLATDVLVSALILGECEVAGVEDAAKFVLDVESQGSPIAKRLAHMVLASQGTLQLDTLDRCDRVIVSRRIAGLKASVRTYSSNAINWMDMAYYYTLLGQDTQAERCVRIATALGPCNRFVLRSAARFWMHRHRPDEALHVLSTSRLSERDPWIAAAEIAITDRLGRSPTKIKRARSMLNNSNLDSYSLSELAASMATIEANAGSRKSAKRLIAKAVVAPTENALAQAEYIARLNNFYLEEPSRTTAAPFEAQARFHYRSDDYRAATDNALEWFYFQPFEARSAVYATYFAAVCMKEYAKAIQVAEYAIKSSPDNFAIVNNLIFASASSDDTAKARLYLPKARSLATIPHQVSVVTATEGLVAFREGDPMAGREKYESAILSFQSESETRLEAIALHYWAREEARVKAPGADQLRALANSKLLSSGVTELL